MTTADNNELTVRRVLGTIVALMLAGSALGMLGALIHPEKPNPPPWKEADRPPQGGAVQRVRLNPVRPTNGRDAPERRHKGRRYIACNLREASDAASSDQYFDYLRCRCNLLLGHRKVRSRKAACQSSEASGRAGLPCRNIGTPASGLGCRLLRANGRRPQHRAKPFRNSRRSAYLTSSRGCIRGIPDITSRP
jgi:hypothetical protein